MHLQRVKKVIASAITAAMVVPGCLMPTSVLASELTREENDLPIVMAGIPVDEKNFPDPCFRAYINKRIDKDGDEVLTQSEIDAVTSITITTTNLPTDTYYNLESVEGIGTFKNVTTIQFGLLPNLKSVDLSSNKAIKQVNVSQCKSLTEVTLGNLPELKVFNSQQSDALVSLDISGCPIINRTYQDGQETIVEKAPGYKHYLDNNNAGGSNFSTALNTKIICGSYEAVEGKVPLDEATFANNMMRRDLYSRFDYDKDGYLNNDERNRVDVYVIYCDPEGPGDTLKYFPNLKTLTCNVKGLLDLDISGLPLLAHLYVVGANLSSLDLTNNPLLEEAYLHGEVYSSPSYVKYDYHNNYVWIDPYLTNIIVNPPAPDPLDEITVFCDDGFSFTLTDVDENGAYDKLVITGEGKMPDLGLDSYNLDEITTVILDGNITSIPMEVISNMPMVTSITLPDSIQQIATGNFDNLPKLTELTIPRSLDSYDLTFDGTKLSKITVNCDCPVASDIEVLNPGIVDVIHNVVTDKAVEATYEAPGLTEGSHCEDCGRVYVAQEVIPQLEVPTAPPTPSPETGVAGFAERLYTCALNRPSDAKGKQDWIEALEAGTFNGAQAAHAFLFSDEVINANISNEEFIERLYATFMDRYPDSDGFLTWMKAFDDGWTREQVFQGFVDSQEWANVCFKYDIASGGAAVPNITLKPNLIVIAFTTRLYTTCLKREGDAEGIKNWSEYLANRRMTGTEVAVNFFFSAEFQAQNVDNGEFVNRLYATFMNRTPDQPGYDMWVGLLDSGEWNRLMVLDGFSQSDEFKQLCKDAGIRP